MNARDEAQILLTQARSLPLGSTGRADLLAQAQTLAVLALTEPLPQPEPEEPQEPVLTPKQEVEQAVKARRKTTAKPKEDKPDA